MQTTEILNTASSVAAKYAQFQAGIFLFIAIIIFCVTTYFSYNINKSTDVYGNNKIIGIVKDSQCTSYYATKKSNIPTYNCNFNILYNIDNKDYIKKMNTNEYTNYTNNKVVNLRYNPNDKNDITTITINNSNSNLSKIIFTIGIIFLIAAIIWLIVLMRNPKFAAGVGFYSFFT